MVSTSTGISKVACDHKNVSHWIFITSNEKMTVPCNPSWLWICVNGMWFSASMGGSELRVFLNHHLKSSPTKLQFYIQFRYFSQTKEIFSYFMGSKILWQINISLKAMAPHSSTLAWRIPWTEEADRLQSMGSLRVGHDWATSLSLLTFMHWRRKWQPTPVFLPGESQGWWSLVGCRLWGRTESDTTEVT